MCEHASLVKDRQRDEEWLWKCEGCGKEMLPEHLAERITLAALYEFIYRDDVHEILLKLVQEAFGYEASWDEEIVARAQHALQRSAENHVRFTF